MPPTKPRYVVTDTGATAEMLDRAQRVWPHVSDRKELLLRLAAVGRDAIEAQHAEAREQQLLADQRGSLERGAARVDVDLLLGDAAWR
jgi:hypothetical protein